MLYALITLVAAAIIGIFLHVKALKIDSEKYGRDYGWLAFGASVITLFLVVSSVLYLSMNNEHMVIREKSAIKEIHFEGNRFFEANVLGNRVMSTSNGKLVQEVFGRDTTLNFNFHEMSQDQIKNYYIYVFNTTSVYGIPKSTVKIHVSSKPYQVYELEHFFQRANDSKVEEKRQ